LVQSRHAEQHLRTLHPTRRLKDVNRYPVIHTWSYKLAEAA
jgi:hypothetical protein